MILGADCLCLLSGGSFTLRWAAEIAIGPALVVTANRVEIPLIHSKKDGPMHHYRRHDMRDAWAASTPSPSQLFVTHRTGE